MVQATLIACKGARIVGKEALALVPTPESTRTFRPVPHHRLVETVEGVLQGCNYRINSMEFALSSNNQQLFAVYTLATDVSDGVCLSIGLASSLNKTIPLRLVGGTRTLICANLQFRSDLISVKRKHSARGELDFNARVTNAIRDLDTFRAAEANRIEWLKQTPLNNEGASHLILQSYKKGLVTTPYLNRVLKEWETPSHDFGPPSLWRLFQAWTGGMTDMQKTNPNRFAAVTVGLNRLIDAQKKEQEHVIAA